MGEAAITSENVLVEASIAEHQLRIRPRGWQAAVSPAFCGLNHASEAHYPAYVAGDAVSSGCHWAVERSGRHIH